MIEVTDEMLKVARSMQSFELMIKRIIELHEQSKPKPEPAGYTLDVLKEYFYAGFMSSGEGFNGEWGGMKSCDTAWEEYSATQNKLQEANKPKPEPVAFISFEHGDWLVKPHEAERMKNIGANFQPLYTAPPTREPLSVAELDELWKASYKEHDDGEKALQNRKRRLKRFARAIEKAHEIGD